MHRIDADGHSANQFTDGNPATGQPGTRVDDDWLNAVQEEICGVVEGHGGTLTKGSNGQAFGLSALHNALVFCRTFWDETTIASFYGRDVLWVNELSLLVAVGDGSTDKIITSGDGSSWTSRLSFSGDRLNGVAWSPSLARAVAVGSNGRVYYSSNGTSWSSTSFGGTYSTMNDCVWVESLSLFVAVGDSDIAETSPDGITWTTRTMPTGDWESVAWSESLGLLVAMGGDICSTSPDGITWTLRTLPVSGYLWKVAWSPHLATFLAVAPTNDDVCVYSEDGVTWVEGAMDQARQLEGIEWIEDLACWVAPGRNGAVAVTANMVDWGEGEINSSPNWGCATWARRLRRLVVLSYNTANIASMS